jgi:hypothetical protein
VTYHLTIDAMAKRRIPVIDRIVLDVPHAPAWNADDIDDEATLAQWRGAEAPEPERIEGRRFTTRRLDRGQN